VIVHVTVFLSIFELGAATAVIVAVPVERAVTVAWLTFFLATLTTFVLLEDNALERLMNLKDNIKNMSYEDIDYIAKYNVLKLEDFVKIISNNKVFLEVPNMSKKNINMLVKIIGDFKENIIILSMNVSVLKVLKKRGFKVSLKIKRKNKRLLNAYFKPDCYCIDWDLLDGKKIRKLKEDFFIIANEVDFNNKEDVLEIYNNVIICR